MGDFFMRKICLIGGDKRNLELAKFLLEDKENNISIFAATMDDSISLFHLLVVKCFYADFPQHYYLYN